MGAARYVGRVGGLAVALGVGTAILGGHGVAWADTGDSGSGASSSSSRRRHPANLRRPSRMRAGRPPTLARRQPPGPLRWARPPRRSRPALWLHDAPEEAAAQPPRRHQAHTEREGNRGRRLRQVRKERHREGHRREGHRREGRYDGVGGREGDRTANRGIGTGTREVPGARGRGEGRSAEGTEGCRTCDDLVH